MNLNFIAGSEFMSLLLTDNYLLIGHGAGSGGGAAGPVYFCGYVGKGEGSRYGGGYGRR
jgi:hypothetical protein